VESNEERVLHVLHEDVAFGHNVLGFVLPHDMRFIQHLNGPDFAIGLLLSQQDLATTKGCKCRRHY
jgi:hypothetical protein